MTKLFDVPEAAKALCVSIPTIRLWISQGRLPAKRFGRKILFTEADLDSFVKLNLKIHPKAEPAGAGSGH